MRGLKLFGMKAVHDEIVASAVKRQHEPQRIVGALLVAEPREKQARSITHQIAAAKLPLAKEIEDFAFAGTPLNEALVRGLAGGGVLAHQRNAVLIGGTGTGTGAGPGPGKSHIAVGIARSCIRGGARGRFFDVVDLVHKLEAEARDGRRGKLADHLCRLDLVVLDELGCLPFAQSGGQLLFPLVSRLHERTSVIVATNLAFGEWPSVFGDEDDDGAPRSAHPPLRHHRDRQRELALQDPRLNAEAHTRNAGSIPRLRLRSDRAGVPAPALKGSLLQADPGSPAQAV